MWMVGESNHAHMCMRRKRNEIRLCGLVPFFTGVIAIPAHSWSMVRDEMPASELRQPERILNVPKAPRGDWTPDRTLTKRTLCQLSYRGMLGKEKIDPPWWPDPRSISLGETSMRGGDRGEGRQSFFPDDHGRRSPSGAAHKCGACGGCRCDIWAYLFIVRACIYCGLACNAFVVAPEVRLAAMASMAIHNIYVQFWNTIMYSSSSGPRACAICNIVDCTCTGSLLQWFPELTCDILDNQETHDEEWRLCLFKGNMSQVYLQAWWHYKDTSIRMGNIYKQHLFMQHIGSRQNRFHVHVCNKSKKLFRNGASQVDSISHLDCACVESKNLYCM